MSTAIQTQNIIQLLTALNEYCWERFLVAYDEVLTDVEPLDELLEQEAKQAGYIAQYANENFDARINLFYSLTMKAFKWDMDDIEPSTKWASKFCMKN